MNVQRISKKTKSNLVIFIAIISLVLVKCIDPYSIGESESSNLLTIDASLIKNCDTQRVVISRSLGLGEKTPDFVNGFTVYVEDEAGNKEYYTPVSDGVYEAVIDDAFLVIGNSYRLIAENSAGEVYQSDYEIITECPPVDSIYTGVEEYYSYTTGDINKALQFYIDIEAKDYDTKYYRWTIKEDWEYKVPYYYTGYWSQDTLFISKDANIDSLRTCYNHGTVQGLYSSSTDNLTLNQKKKIPLNYLFQGNVKVSSRYSILVSQYSLTDKAYSYWQQKKVEIQESDGLFSTQPSQPQSNIHNTSDSKEIVLGYFWAGSKTEKRVFYNTGFGKAEYGTCEKDTIESFVPENPGDEFWYYFYVVVDANYDTTYITSDDKCFDCRMHGGTLTPPEFWKD